MARQDVIDQAPETLRDFVHGWFDGIDMIEEIRRGLRASSARRSSSTPTTVSGMLSGLKLTPFADNAQFFGLTGGKAQFDTLFDTAFVIWRKKGLVTEAVDAKDWVDTRFVRRWRRRIPGRRCEEPKIAAEGADDERPRDRQQADPDLLHPGSDEIMPGSYFMLDSLGDTMTSFGNTYLRVEGNTDSRAPPTRT